MKDFIKSLFATPDDEPSGVTHHEDSVPVHDVIVEPHDIDVDTKTKRIKATPSHAPVPASNAVGYGETGI